MNFSEVDRRKIALVLSRGRCVVGLASIFLPGLVGRVWVGRSDPAVRAVVRAVGIRDLALGVGALTAVKEEQHDAEWLSMGAACDGFDALVSLASPGLPRRARLIGLGAAGAGATLMSISRWLADERQAAAPAG
jgi:hypothetical protein